MAGPTLKSYQFRREREQAWRSLEDILGRIEKMGFDALPAADLARLPVLYRNVVSSLSVARAISLDQNVLAYLENLAARAYLAVYRPKRALLETLRHYLLGSFPAQVWQVRYKVLLALLLLASGTLCGFFLVRDDPNYYYSFVSEGMAQGRDPTASPETLREVLYDEEDPEGSTLTTFAAFLFSHNARIGIFAFALGFLGGVPVMLLLFYNGLVLGAMGALYDRAGLGMDFWAWISGHGVTELLAVALCGGAGLALGGAVIFPGRYRRLDQLAMTGRKMAAIVMGAVILFMMAALLEGYFRQIVHDPGIRYAMGGATLLFWMAYFFRPSSEAS